MWNLKRRFLVFVVASAFCADEIGDALFTSMDETSAMRFLRHAMRYDRGMVEDGGGVYEYTFNRYSGLPEYNRCVSHAVPREPSYQPEWDSAYERQSDQLARYALEK